MQVVLKPELEEFVAEQVQRGKFSSTAEVIEAGHARLMVDPEPEALDEETLAAIDRSEEQIERGEYRAWSEVSAEPRRKHLGK